MIFCTRAARIRWPSSRSEPPATCCRRRPVALRGGLRPRRRRPPLRTRSRTDRYHARGAVHHQLDVHDPGAATVAGGPGVGGSVYAGALNVGGSLHDGDQFCGQSRHRARCAASATTDATSTLTGAAIWPRRSRHKTCTWAAHLTLPDPAPLATASAGALTATSVSAGTLTASGTTDATTTGTGALQISGGLGAPRQPCEYSALPRFGGGTITTGTPGRRCLYRARPAELAASMPPHHSVRQHDRRSSIQGVALAADC